jgi:hypothetical protein
VTVLATLNSDGNLTAAHPTVSLIGIEEAEPGQVYLSYEFPIASKLHLSTDSGKTYTKNIGLDFYLDKTQGSNTFGRILDTAGSVIGKLPIPPNPYTDALKQFAQFANDTIAKETKDSGGQLVAQVQLEFNDRDQASAVECKREGFETTGAIGVIGTNGPDSGDVITDKEIADERYCWAFSDQNTYAIKYAPRPNTGGCEGVPTSSFKEVPNDYVMIILSAQIVIPSHINVLAQDARALFARRQQDLLESRKVCDLMKLDHIYCGAE